MKQLAKNRTLIFGWRLEMEAAVVNDFILNKKIDKEIIGKPNLFVLLVSAYFSSPALTTLVDY